MQKRTLFYSAAIGAMLLCACATGTSVAEAPDGEASISITDISSTSGEQVRLASDLDYKILGMPDAITSGNVLLGWPGSGVATQFEGSQLLATIDGAPDTYLDIQINDVQKTVQLTEGRVTYRLIDAMPGTYDVSIRIRTERPYRPIVFEGFSTDDGVISAPGRSELQFLVLGDDVATGYGVEGENQFCKYDRETQNANLSFAVLSATDLKADAAVIARSGRGLTKNWNNDTAPTMVELYKNTMAEGAHSALGEMDAVIVQVGSMDVAQEDIQPDFKIAYDNLLTDIRMDHPNAEIVASWGPMGHGDRYEAGKSAVLDVVANRKAAGDNRVSFIEFTNTEFGQRYGCNWHPSADTQRFMASRLTDHLAERLEIDVDLDELLLGG
ncbi:MAG: hypothetical protein AAF950_03370 [Pseudomonadota bacterium]